MESGKGNSGEKPPKPKSCGEWAAKTKVGFGLPRYDHSSGEIGGIAAPGNGGGKKTRDHPL